MLPFGEFLKKDLQGAKWGAIQGHPQFLITPLVSEPGKIYIRELSSRIHIHARHHTHFQLTDPSLLLDTFIACMVKQILEEEEEEKKKGKKRRGGKLTHPACG